ncbi:MAG: hypothetical protein AAGC90_05190 [Curtobacterium sp.]
MTAVRAAVRRPALRFTTTLVVAAPYVLLILPMAVWNDTPGTDFIVRTAGLALLGTVAVEGSLALIATAEVRSGRRSAPRPEHTDRWDAGRVATVARWVAVTAAVTNIVLVSLGGLTLTSQVNSVLPTGVLTLLSPFLSWSYLALALVLAADQLGGMRRASSIRWSLMLVGSQVAVAFIRGITAGAATFTVVALTLALATRFVRARWIVATASLGIALWPVVFAVRNDLRRGDGIAVSDAVTASDRLRFDEQIVRAQQYGTGHDLGQPDLWAAVRYGLVPRFLDPERPAISSGNAINEFLGGSSFSSYTFLPVATTWFFWGGVVVVLLYAVFAAVMVSLRPWDAIGRRPIALVLATLLLSGPLAWFSTPPDASIALLQAAVAASPVVLVLWVWARERSR